MINGRLESTTMSVASVEVEEGRGKFVTALDLCVMVDGTVNVGYCRWCTGKLTCELLGTSGKFIGKIVHAFGNILGPAVSWGQCNHHKVSHCWLYVGEQVYDSNATAWKPSLPEQWKQECWPWMLDSEGRCTQEKFSTPENSLRAWPEVEIDTKCQYSTGHLANLHPPSMQPWWLKAAQRWPSAWQTS